MEDQELINFLKNQPLAEIEKNHSFLVQVAQVISKKLEASK